MVPNYTLELLHFADQEASSSAIENAPNLSAVLSALRAQDLGADGLADNTLTLSSGDAFIPGVFFDAGAAVFGAPGIADVQIQNELGVQAIALGNHEFDLGTAVLAGLIDGTAPGDFTALTASGLAGQDFTGTAFPYLSANLDFGTDANLAPLAVTGGEAPQGNVVTSSTVIDVNGEAIGVVGATTPTLDRIASPGDVGIRPGAFDDTPTPAQLDALAAEIQAEVDALLTADAALNKVVLLSHMQRLNIEEALAARLTDVDVIVAGGSNTRLLDADDRARSGDTDQGPYPIFVANAGGMQTAVVNTDGSYKYVGRLVIEFDEAGAIVPASYDPAVSGAYATDDAGVTALGAEGAVDPEVQAIVDAIEAQILATEGNVVGASDVFLNGNRSGGPLDGVRTQETNLGNLTADANLVAAQAVDSDVVVSIKNGGGIRASIGETVVLPGDTEASRVPNAEIVDGDGDVVRPEGGISQNDIQTTLAFNNGLSLLTLTRAELVEVLEYGVAALPSVAGRFPQVSGVEFSFDPDAPAGSRIRNAEIVREDGTQVAALVRGGEVVGDPAETFRIVTLNFLAGGGDGYPFPQGDDANRVDLTDAALPAGDATFAAAGSEQDALAEFLLSLDAPYAEADTGIEGDTRIQNLSGRADTVFEGEAIVINEILVSTTGNDAEYVELFGGAGASLAGLSVIGLEGDEGNSGYGDYDFRFDFDDMDVLGDNGFYLVANSIAESTYGVTANASIGSNSLENSSATYALVETASLVSETFTGEERVRDAVALSDDGDDPSFFDAPVIGPDGSFLPAGAGRIQDGVDTDTAADFAILNFFNDSPPNTPTAGTFGGDAGGGDASIDDALTLISAVQGAGADSPLAGRQVVVEGIVTGDFQDGDADDRRDLGGFFLMEEAADRDADALTSEGLFAFEGGDTALDVAEGDRVRVLGTVEERFGKTIIRVEETRIEEAAAVADVRSLAVETPLPDADAREAFESMLITITEELTFSESFAYERFQEALFTTGGQVYQYTQRNLPDAAGNAAYQEEVADRSLIIEDGLEGSRADGDPIFEPDGDTITDPSAFRMGQTLTDQTGILDFGFGEYRLRVPQSASFELEEADEPLPAAPEEVGSDYKVASLNVLNYFTTIDAGGATTDNGSGPRGAESAAEFARQTQKLVTIIEGIDSDVIGLVELENDFAGDAFAIKRLVTELNASAGFAQWDFVDPGQAFVGDDAIAVGFIYDQTTTRLLGDAAILDAPEFLDPLGDLTTGDSYNRAALAQTFEEIETGGAFTASVNHFKSKGSPTGAAADEDQGDGAGRNDATRAAAAQELADWLATDPTGTGDEDVMILGDLNAYARETPIRVLEDAGYTDLARALEGDDVYSYRFSGQIGTLDYALANAALEAQVTGATTWNVNADTPFLFDYNLDGTFTSTLRPTDQGLFDGNDPSKASDHDPVIVGLDLAPERLLLAGTARNDRLDGTDADELIDAGGGRLDVVRGGGGADTFLFTDTDGLRDGLRILDFDTETDVLDLGGAEIASLREVRGSVRITLEGDRDSITLAGVGGADAITFADQFFV